MPKAKKKTAGKSAAKKPKAKKPIKKHTPKSAAKKTSHAKKPAPKKKTVKATAKPRAKRTPNAAFMRPLVPSAALATVIGAMPLPRTEVTKKMWDYIKKNKLQDSINKRLINANEDLQEIFSGKKQVSMFEMPKLIAKHLT